MPPTTPSIAPIGLDEASLERAAASWWLLRRGALVAERRPVADRRVELGAEARVVEDGVPVDVVVFDDGAGAGACRLAGADGSGKCC